MTFTPEVWNGVLRRLQAEMPTFSFEAWLAPLEPQVDDSGLVLMCPSSFHRDRIRSHFLPQIHRCLSEIAGESMAVELGIATAQTGARAAPVAAAAPDPLRCEPSKAPPARERRRNLHEPPPRPGGRATAAQTRQSDPATPSGPAASPFTFDSFVVGPCNALAREAALAIARGEQRNLNQLYLRSAPGMGKTHLARAVADAARCLGNADVRYVSAERFTNEFLFALQNRSTREFKKRYRGRRQLLVMEDVQFLASKQATQLEFFHTVQHVLDAGGKLVFTGDRMPHEMPDLAARVRSQLAGGFVAELEPPDARVRRAILRSKAAHGGVKLPADCLDLLVDSISGSVRDLESVLVQLVNTASLLKRPIDQPLTRDAIEKKTSRTCVPAHTLDIASVIGVVSGFFQTSPERLASRSRKKEVLLPRQLTMYLCRRYTEASVSEIGAAFGRDHPSVRNAILKIERAMLERAPLRYQVEALSDRLDRMLGPNA